ncbi:LysR family transcriptional regulator [Alloalcanivorax xenomutans]|jgi:DNA-binding transcriptional LysR family regulator|uniref:LysR family transcriptional regulator n=1 Tax=Alloalcanivorax xenomutans TaxID=1094342 RepID=A0A9Q3W673_9GAMM|nr:LysR family transcriptional regulator [Alloalcanivorax xenomutans]ERS11385.1 LysR family transcriptional regulator [Alcanivorax sp. PN-3]KYZ86169.1 LysR family transcriptional regulator [Alcanivorax sp. KX64203]MBA4719542.1 LysR family transcriptional regulator [Alcanivorax sp.]ARB44112.1 LysR family transcriptional regulator [Alloalcanivorax xenomutans]MCE7511250.1 LysR family transcriptional regulator [Alloalcanivorax xenomutans]|tara:strand:+ start:2602 stop:3486 length:885 start_codon:yes stop_codon:yes gene_type:complete
MRYTLRQLEVFLAVAHHENVSRAARDLNMSQSAASGALKELETQFDIKLFERAGKKLRLNELGRQLWPRAEALLGQARDLESGLQAHQELGRLKVGATLTIGNYLAVNIMARYMAEQPGAQVKLEVANTATIVDRVLAFDLDMGLIEGEINHTDLELLPWREDELVVFCAPDHPLAKQETLSDEDLLAATWIVRETGSGTRQTFERAMHGLLPGLKLLLELEHTEAIKRAVEAGLGISCLSRVSLREAFRRGSLVPLTVPGRDFSREFYFVLHRQKYRSPGVERWLELCRQSPE